MSVTAQALEWQLEISEVKAWEKQPTTTKPPFARLDAEITLANRLLELGEDWDGERSPGYLKTTLDRATDFLKTQAQLLWKTHSLELPTPHINAGPSGSIDLHWKNSDRELLVNI